MAKTPLPPILSRKNPDEPSVFEPRNLLREARRQHSLPDGQVPAICVLDPDGDIVRNLTASGAATLNPSWACYHTRLYDFAFEGIEFGIVGCAVGAPFAVLVAEEMFASGCRLLISMTSSGQILAVCEPPYFVLIERALRDEGTSYHYLAPSEYCAMGEDLGVILEGAFADSPEPVERGATWTTDAPFRETASAIAHCRDAGVLAVEMEAAALYAFARARKKPVICFAHVTNQMGVIEGDFEKGDGMGGDDALTVIAMAARTWLRSAGEDENGTSPAS
jgi:uridine phosphorylase